MSKRQFFGTDGVRGTANQHPMTAEFALKLGMAAGSYGLRGTHRHRVVIAKDTRLSGYLIEPALTAGFIAAGMDVVLVGPLPTPAVAMLTRSLRADMGVMISASHNAYQDNGIKLFGPDGYKLSDEAELEIEAKIIAGPAEGELATPDKLGRATRLEDARGRYVEFLKHSFPKNLRLDGLSIVLDCANGAAYNIGPNVLWELGAEVIPVGVDPNGLNINRDCGSTQPVTMQQRVLETGAHLGIALDGDADRLVMCDHTGQLLNGDQIMAIIASFWAEHGLLKGGSVVATEMTNLGMEHYLNSLGVGLVRTDVGDRYVMEAMRARGCNLGGEQSGHIILSDYATTGDGLLAALQVLALLVERNVPLAKAAQLYSPMPQLLKNVRYSAGEKPLELPKVQAAIADAQSRLVGKGRLFIRKSGTEPLIRIMAEGEDEALLDEITDEIARAMAA
jgi:phosphoglucosamine mutase